ncbi:hypothetical protein ALC62_10263 [Cyphomyrmex costatus]|uniref:Uncharacterized protein n=1 Tax=Cyphomyrmex costatus TaxID=456900 RepID=A0A151IEA9_9HYME|nr:hypothetical protein ALC62_10263 [Cyphomyrmex costatus]
MSPGPSTSAPVRGQQEQWQQESAARPSLSPVVKGDNQWGGVWTVSVGRRARRRRLNAITESPPSSPESPPIANNNNIVSPTSAAPLSALIVASMDAHNKTLNMDKTPSPIRRPIGAERRREASTGDHAGGDAGYGAGDEVSAGRPSAPLYACGVMPRGRCAPSSVVPPRVAREEGDRQRRGRQRVEDARGGPSRGQPAPATVARQRRRERVAARDALVARAEAVASIADLEEFATSVADFFREDASAPGAAGRARDRPVRPREAGARRMARGGERAVREGADRPGPATAGSNRRRGGPADQCQVPKRQVQEHFKRVYSGGEDLASAGVDAERADPPRS